MNNSINSIAFSIFSNKGVFALLLGSGISRNSGIPTGWDIVIDLIRKLALLEGEDCSPKPEVWYELKYNEEPDYSVILEKLAPTPSERLNILKPYFEPTEEEKEQGLKEPTLAHLSIAKLIKKGYIKIIITTNFDRLLERAIRNEGIEPIVVRHPSDIEGTIPLVHSDFTLLKVNGDYLDNRFLNTKKELDTYEDSLSDFALRIINEYGIISCGWSGKWDTGLVNALKQCSNFRYSSYWTFVSECNPELSEIAFSRKGKNIKVNNADDFFSELNEKIEALEALNDDPISVDIAIARLKKYISKEEYKILLYDLLLTELSSIINVIDDNKPSSLYPNKENLSPILEKYLNSLDIVIPLVIDGVFWSKSYHHNYFIEMIERVTKPPILLGGTYDDSKNLHYFPALLLMYSLGLTAIKTKNFELLFLCFKLNLPKDNEYTKKESILKKLNSSLIERKIFNEIISQNYKTPVSTFIHKYLRPYFKKIIFNDNEYIEVFNFLEYFISLNYIDLVKREYGIWAPCGEFHWRYSKEDDLLTRSLERADIEKNQWEPIKEGMFNNSYEHFLKIKQSLDDFLSKIHL